MCKVMLRRTSRSHVLCGRNLSLLTSWLVEEENEVENNAHLHLLCCPYVLLYLLRPDFIEFLNISLNTSNSLLSTSRSEFAPIILLSNVMSFAPKIGEICVYISQHDFDLIFRTETWLRDSVGDNYVALTNYNLIRRDRTVGIHGRCLPLSEEIDKVQMPG